MKIQKLRVIKRDGRQVGFNRDKIENAILAAMKETEEKLGEDKIISLVDDIIDRINNEEISVEDIQDIVQKVLIERNEDKIVERYIIYRSERNEAREANSELMKEYKELVFSDSEDSDTKRENANVDGNCTMGTMLQFGTSGAKRFAIRHQLKASHRKAHANGDIHIHDLDFMPTGTTTCLQIDFKELAKGGFSTGHGHLREPQDIISYAALAAIAIQSDQNDQHGMYARVGR